MNKSLPFLRGFLITFAILLLMMAAFLGGYYYHSRQVDVGHFSLLEEAYLLLTTRGLKEPPPTPALQYGMIRGMLQAYDDPYTAFFEPPVHELQTDQLEGKYGGIGVNMDKDDQGNWVLWPFPDGPARQAGVQDGDRLLAIEDLLVTGETSAEVIQAAARGPAGKYVTITIARYPDFQPQQISIQRQEIAIPSVSWRLEPSQPLAGVIRVNLMASSTSGEILRAVKDLQQRGATHFILDLRDNPGGYLTAGIQVARLFLEKGVIMQQQYRAREIETFSVERRGPLADIPLVVLVNHHSASAAEIVAGALQVAGRAPLIGAPTYGKDTIQLVFELSDKSSLHLTAARWWVPGLETSFAGNGLQPDILVDPLTSSDGIDRVLQAALQTLFENR